MDQTQKQEALPTEVVVQQGAPVPAVAIDQPKDLLALYEIAGLLSKSELYPDLKGAAGMFAVVLYGRELGIPTMTSLQTIKMVEGRPSLDATMQLAIAGKHGVRWKVISRTTKGAVIDFTWPAKEREWRSEFLEDDAKQAGLIGKNKVNWNRYPKNMYFWRAVTNGLKIIAPEIFSGIYTPDELTDGETVTLQDFNDAEHKAARRAGKKPTADLVSDVQIATIKALRDEDWITADVAIWIDEWLKDTQNQTRQTADKVISRLNDVRKKAEATQHEAEPEKAQAPDGAQDQNGGGSTPVAPEAPGSDEQKESAETTTDAAQSDQGGGSDPPASDEGLATAQELGLIIMKELNQRATVPADLRSEAVDFVAKDIEQLVGKDLKGAFVESVKKQSLDLLDSIRFYPVGDPVVAELNKNDPAIEALEAQDKGPEPERLPEPGSLEALIRFIRKALGQRTGIPDQVRADVAEWLDKATESDQLDHVDINHLKQLGADAHEWIRMLQAYPVGETEPSAPVDTPEPAISPEAAPVKSEERLKEEARINKAISEIKSLEARCFVPGPKGEKVKLGMRRGYADVDTLEAASLTNLLKLRKALGVLFDDQQAKGKSNGAIK